MSAPLPDVNVSPGDRLAGKYLITRLLGRGGMGVVAEATRIGIGERVAIKVLHERYIDNEEARARFHHEAAAVARIRGEHSARLLDMGMTDSGAPFLVMELLEGADLAALLKAGPLPEKDALLYILQACEGMAEVHANGIVHRDLKPANLFVTRTLDGAPLVKVLDFGIAKSGLPMDDSTRAITMTLVALGTPLYMAPEQVRCSKDVDARADVWSLGAILYEMLAGQPAFGGNSTANITAQVLEATPKALQNVAPGLDRAVQKALSKRPEGRYLDIAAFARTLAPFADEAARVHAERATRILAAAPQGATGVPMLASGTTLLGGETQMQTEIFEPDLGDKARSRWMGGLIALLGVAALVIAGLVVDAFQSAAPASLRASSGVAAASAVRGAVVRTTLRMELAAPAPEPPAPPVALAPKAAPAPKRAAAPPAKKTEPTAAELLSTRR